MLPAGTSLRCGVRWKMSTAAKHVAAGRRNESLVPTLVGAVPPAFDWAVTVVYYAAVHYGRAFLAANGGKATTSHRMFDSQFIGAGGDQKQYNNYRTLKDTSESSRYDCVEFDRHDVDKMINDHMVPFRDYCLANPKLASVLGPPSQTAMP